MTEDRYFQLSGRVAEAPDLLALDALARVVVAEPADDLRNTLLWTIDHKRAAFEVGKDYDEAQHPRDERGRWTEAGGGATTGEAMPPGLEAELARVMGLFEGGGEAEPEAEPLPHRLLFMPGDHPSTAKIEDFEHAIAPMQVEHGLLFNRDGDVIAQKVGTSTGVRWDKGELERDAALMIHNHPSGACPSPSDVGASVAHGLDEVRAVSRWADGTEVIYSLKGLGNYAPDIDREYAGHRARAAVEQVRDGMGAKYLDLVQPPGPMPRDVAAFHSPLPWSAPLSAEIDHAIDQWKNGATHIYHEPVSHPVDAAQAARSMVVWREHTHQAMTKWAAKNGLTYTRTVIPPAGRKVFRPLRPQ